MATALNYESTEAFKTRIYVRARVNKLTKFSFENYTSLDGVEKNSRLDILFELKIELQILDSNLLDYCIKNDR